MEQRGPSGPPRHRHRQALREAPPRPRPRPPPRPQPGPRRSPFSRRRRRLTPPPWPGAAGPRSAASLTDAAAPQPSWGHMTPRPLTPPPGSGATTSPAPFATVVLFFFLTVAVPFRYLTRDGPSGGGKQQTDPGPWGKTAEVRRGVSWEL